MSAETWADGDVRAEVLRRLAEAAGAAQGQLNSADTSLRDDLGLDSLDAILLVLELEEQLLIDIEDDELASLHTVGELLELIEGKCRAAGPGPT